MFKCQMFWFHSALPEFSGLTIGYLHRVRSFHPRPLGGGNWLRAVLSSVHSSTQGPEQTSWMTALDTRRNTLIWLGHSGSTWLPLGLLHSCLSSHTPANGRKGDTQTNKAAGMEKYCCCCKRGCYYQRQGQTVTANVFGLLGQIWGGIWFQRCGWSCSLL